MQIFKLIGPSITEIWKGMYPHCNIKMANIWAEMELSCVLGFFFFAMTMIGLGSVYIKCLCTACRSDSELNKKWKGSERI